MRVCMRVPAQDPRVILSQKISVLDKIVWNNTHYVQSNTYNKTFFKKKFAKYMKAVW